jgi:hypothetical protein
MEFAIFAYILLFSHLRRDKDFSQNVKTTSWVVFGIIGVIYIIFRIIF